MIRVATSYFSIFTRGAAGGLTALAVLTGAFFLASCTHQPVRVPEGGGLYPFGKYQHAVKIQIVQPEKTMEMSGVVSYTPASLKVIGLSSFGTTVFRIEENLATGELKKEFYLDVIRQNEERFLGFYKMIRELMLAPKGATEFERGPAKFVVSEPDSAGIYRKIKVDHPQVRLAVDVTKYEFGGTQ